MCLQAAAPSKRKKVEEDTGPPISINEPKEKRFKEERNMKVSHPDTCQVFQIEGEQIDFGFV